MAIVYFDGGFSTQATANAGTVTRMAPGTAMGNRDGEAVVTSVNFVARRKNVGKIWIGGSAIGTHAYDGLEPGDVLQYNFGDRFLYLSHFYFVTDTDGDGVTIHGMSV